MRATPLELKVILAVIAISVAVAMGGAAVVARTMEHRVEGAAAESLKDAAEAFAAQQKAEIEKLALTLDALLANERLRDAFERRDREGLDRLARPLFETMRDRDRITHWYFIEPDPSREVFLRVHQPTLRGDRVERVTLARAVETSDLGAGMELGKTAFALRVVRPWIHGGRVLGYMELAEEIDHFLTAMKARTGDEYGLLVMKKSLDPKDQVLLLGGRASSWNDRPDVVVVDATSFTDTIIDYRGDLEELPDEGRMLGEVSRGDRAYLRGIFPVHDAAGRHMGGLFVLHDFTAPHRALHAARGETLGALLALTLAGGVLVVLLLHALVFKPIARVRQQAERLGGGAGPSSLDDLGRLAALVDGAVARAPAAQAAPAAPATPAAPAPPVGAVGREPGASEGHGGQVAR